MSYSMEQGDKRSSKLEFYDWNYDGQWKGKQLSNGLGALVDGILGPDDYKLGYYAKSKIFLYIIPASLHQFISFKTFRSKTFSIIDRL